MFKEIDNLYSKLKSLRPLSPESVRRLSEDFMIDNTFNSNAIEGSTLTLEETALVLKEGYPPISIKFSNVSKYYDCFDHYRTNVNDSSKMTGLVSRYMIAELLRYIDIAEQAHWE